jgi:hypothetical protein
VVVCVLDVEKAKPSAIFLGACFSGGDEQTVGYQLAVRFPHIAVVAFKSRLEPESSQFASFQLLVAVFARFFLGDALIMNLILQERLHRKHSWDVMRDVFNVASALSLNKDDSCILYNYCLPKYDLSKIPNTESVQLAQLSVLRSGDFPPACCADSLSFTCSPSALSQLGLSFPHEIPPVPYCRSYHFAAVPPISVSVVCGERLPSSDTPRSLSVTSPSSFSSPHPGEPFDYKIEGQMSSSPSVHLSLVKLGEDNDLSCDSKTPGMVRLAFHPISQVGTVIYVFSIVSVGLFMMTYLRVHRTR